MLLSLFASFCFCLSFNRLCVLCPNEVLLVNQDTAQSKYITKEGVVYVLPFYLVSLCPLLLSYFTPLLFFLSSLNFPLSTQLVFLCFALLCFAFISGIFTSPLSKDYTTIQPVNTCLDSTVSWSLLVVEKNVSARFSTAIRSNGSSLCWWRATLWPIEVINLYNFKAIQPWKTTLFGKLSESVYLPQD